MKNALAFALILAGCGSPIPAPSDLAESGDGGGGGGDMVVEGCSPKCSGLTPFCNASKHCVACTEDSQCAMGSYCKITSDAVATCTPGCMTDDRCANGQKCCDMRCVDLMADVKNCGGCGMACMAVHSSATCAGGMCKAGMCDSGWGDCDKDGQNGCEANLHADVNNCTACGMMCSIPNAFAGCADGCYASACKFGFDDCNLNAMDGCETSVLSDPKNCGGCGKSCANLPNAMAGCTNGNCVLQMCTLGYADCDNNAGTGCEVKVATDAKNCGKCGNVCPNGLICTNGGCTCPQCNFPNATSVCINNVCMLDKCVAGFFDCDKMAANGCEVDGRFDSKNCGMCGNVCPMNTPACNNSVCSVGRLHWQLVEPSACNAWCGGQGGNFPCAQSWTCDMVHLNGYMWIYSASQVEPPLTVNANGYGWVSWFCGANGGCRGPGPNAGTCMGGGQNTVWQCVFN